MHNLKASLISTFASIAFSSNIPITVVLGELRRDPTLSLGSRQAVPSAINADSVGPRSPSGATHQCLSASLQHAAFARQCGCSPRDCADVFNVVAPRNSPSAAFSTGKALTVDEFDFQRVEEAFGDSVMVAIALATHRADEPVVLGQALVGLRAVLTSPVMGGATSLVEMIENGTAKVDGDVGGSCSTCLHHGRVRPAI